MTTWLSPRHPPPHPQRGRSGWRRTMNIDDCPPDEVTALPAPPTPVRRRPDRSRRHPVRIAAAGLVLVVVLVAGLHFEQYTGAPAVGEDCAIKANLATAPSSSATAGPAGSGAPST